MRQWQSSLQQITHIRGRKGRQNLEFQLVKQFWIPSIGLLPLQFDVGHEPQGRSRECHMMFPGAILACLEIIPTQFRLGVLVGALHEVPLATGFNQLLGRRIWWVVQQHESQAATEDASDDDPLCAHLHLL